jgi:large subunit ribosomal protein L1
LKPSSSKGTYVKGVALSSTMGPGIRLDPNEVVKLSQEAR